MRRSPTKWPKTPLFLSPTSRAGIFVHTDKTPKKKAQADVMYAHKCKAEDRPDYKQGSKPTEGPSQHGGTAEAEEGLTKAQMCFLESCRPQSKRATLKFMEPSERPPLKFFSPMGHHIPSPPSKGKKSIASQSPRQLKFKQPTLSTISQPQVQHSVKLTTKLRWRSHLGSAFLDEDPPDFREGGAHMIRPYFYTVRADPFLSPLRSSNNRADPYQSLPRIPVIAPPRSCEK